MAFGKLHHPPSRQSFVRSATNWHSEIPLYGKAMLPMLYGFAVSFAESSSEYYTPRWFVQLYKDKTLSSVVTRIYTPSAQQSSIRLLGILYQKRRGCVLFGVYGDANSHAKPVILKYSLENPVTFYSGYIYWRENRTEEIRSQSSAQQSSI